MAADAAELQSMEAFVRALFQEKPDLSILTNAIVRQKYLLHSGRNNMAKEQKEQLRQIVAQELNRMEAQEEEEDSASTVEFVAEFKTQIHSRVQKRPRYNSDTSDEEFKSQELKKQRTGSMPEVISKDEDSGIDSKKIPLSCSPKHVGPRKSSSFSDQEDFGAERQASGSESDGQCAKRRRRQLPSSGEGSEPTMGQQSRTQSERSRSESKETTEEEQSDNEPIRKQKAAKGQRIKSGSDSEQELSKLHKKKGSGKQQKQTEVVRKGKNRNTDDPRRKKEEESEEEMPKAGKMCKQSRVDWSESEEEFKGSEGKKAQNRPRRRHWKAQEESESEDESEIDSEDEEPSRQNKKRRNSKPSRESVRAWELGRDSDSARGKSRTRKEKCREARRTSEKWDHNSESDSEDGEVFKRQASKGMTKAQKRKELEEEMWRKHKRSRKPSSSEDESSSESEEMERDKSKPKMSGSSDKSEDGSEEWESRNWRKKRKLKKKYKSESGSEYSSEEELLRKKREKAQRKRTIAEKDVETDSEDSRSELVGRKKGLRNTGMQKRKRRREASSSSEDEDEPRSSKHRRKDKEHRSRKYEEHSSIRRLKRYIWECGAHRNYKKLLGGYHSRKAQLKVLKEELENLGLKGPPSLAKCKALKKKREAAAEIASLDLCNIITTQGRPKRRSAWSLYSKPEHPRSPEDSPVRGLKRHWAHLKDIISSDGESG